MKYLTITEIIEKKIIPVSRRTLLRLIATGRIAAKNFGAGKTPRWSVAEDEIDRYLRTKT